MGCVHREFSHALRVSWWLSQSFQKRFTWCSGFSARNIWNVRVSADVGIHHGTLEILEIPARDDVSWQNSLCFVFFVRSGKIWIQVTASIVIHRAKNTKEGYFQAKLFTCCSVNIQNAESRHWLCCDQTLPDPLPSPPALALAAFYALLCKHRPEFGIWCEGPEYHSGNESLGCSLSLRHRNFSGNITKSLPLQLLVKHSNSVFMEMLKRVFSYFGSINKPGQPESFCCQWSSLCQVIKSYVLTSGFLYATLVIMTNLLFCVSENCLAETCDSWCYWFHFIYVVVKCREGCLMSDVSAYNGKGHDIDPGMGEMCLCVRACHLGTSDAGINVF